MKPISPMLASAVDRLPTGAGWAYEFKWDGVRALLDVSEAGVTIRSRAGNDITGGYPELVAAASGLDDALLDGEIVALVAGRPSFEALQRRMHARGPSVGRLVEEVPVSFVVFDLLRRFGVDLTGRPYVERRATLDRWLEQHPGWTVSPFFDDGEATLAAARQHGLEGVVAKRLASLYYPGGRGTDWQKLRFVRTGDFVVIGWESSDERPDVLSSLVLANRSLEPVGKVGSGLTDKTVRALQRALIEVRGPQGRASKSSPWSRGNRNTHWVEPSVVVEVKYSERTSDGVLRQPVFLRVRDDKTPEDADG